MTWSTIIDTGCYSMNEQISQGVFDYTLFLLTAARGCVDEPHMYGPLRLVDAVSRIIDIFSRANLIQDPFLTNLKKKIDEKKFVVMESEDEFVKFIDDLIATSVEEMKRRMVGRS